MYYNEVEYDESNYAKERGAIMWTTLEIQEQITLLGILFTLCVGLLNLMVTIHKNRVDVITQNRMNWISDVRKISSSIINWRYFDDTKDLLNPINELTLYLNVSKIIDEKIVASLLAMYDYAYKLSFYHNLRTNTAKDLYENYYKRKQEFRILIRIYLKKEWTRMKVECRIIKIPFVNFWIPGRGFNEKWATNTLMKEYEHIKQYEFKPWIEFSEVELKDLICDLNEQEELKKAIYDLCKTNTDVFASEDGGVYFSTEILDKYLKHNDNNIFSKIIDPDEIFSGGDGAIKVPDGKMA